MMRLFFPLFVGFICLASQSVEAQACSCVGQTPARQVAAADQVLLARVVSETSLKTGYRTEFEVLHTVKGSPVRSFTWDRKEKNPLCGPSYGVGEFTMLFVKNNDLPLCAGNYGLSITLNRFSQFLRSAGHKAGPLSHADMQALLETTLKGYLHKRPRITAYYGPLAGKTLQIEDTTIRFRKAGKWIQNPDKFPKRAIVVVDATRWRDIGSLSAVYLKEGLSIRILFRETDGGITVLQGDIVEQ